jgi:hypothetical protein
MMDSWLSDCNNGAVARSLYEARQQAAKRLDEQVARAVREPEPDKRRVVDRRRDPRLARRRTGHQRRHPPTASPAPVRCSTMSSSRLAVDASGRLVCVVTVGGMAAHVGERFLVVDLFELGFTRPGHPPSAGERDVTSRHFYDSNSAKRQRTQEALNDDELDEDAAVAAAYAEQRREPVDLIGRAA